MQDLISRQAAIEDIRTMIPKDAQLDIKWIEMWLMQLPSAQPERKKGKWIKKMLVTKTEKYISYNPEWYCACCGAKYDSHIAKIVNFCYVCGADMRGEQDE